MTYKQSNVVVYDDQYNSLWKLTPDSANILKSVIQSAQILVQGYTYRANLQSLVWALETDQTLRHGEVDKILELLNHHGHHMSQFVKDQAYMIILELLNRRNLTDSLPPPRW